MKLTSILSEMFYPSGIKCIVCGNELDETGPQELCPRCTLPENTNFCHSCGRGMTGMSDFCDLCISEPNVFTMARAPYLYDGNVKILIKKLKYGDGRYLSRIFAVSIAKVFEISGKKGELVTFVPMLKSRKRRRGYNQAQLIAAEFGKLAGLPVKELLARSGKNQNFARMTRKERIAAITGSIACIPEAGISGKSVILIDDVLTSGATANECAKALKASGAAAVYVLTFATSSVLPVLY